jgi:hypothetical protein
MHAPGGGDAVDLRVVRADVRGRSRALAARLVAGTPVGVFSRLAALGGVLLASGLFARSAGGRTEMLVILSAIMAVTTLFILLLSLWPKGMWALAWISPPLIVGLVAFGSF